MKTVKSRYNITFYVPLLDNESFTLRTFLNKTCGFNQLTFFSFPSSFYKLSRDNSLIFFIKTLISSITWPLHLLQIKELKNFDCIYINGNKAGFFILLFCFCSRFSKKVIWHFRDYPNNSTISSLSWFLVGLIRPANLVIVGNSKSVMSAMQQVFPQVVNCDYVYNPTGELATKIKKTDSSHLQIGVISMLAPWKGIHAIILFSHLFNDLLMKLNITKINFYGENIYQTTGLHQEYANQLKKLLKKFPCKLINFCGTRETTDIFNEIDILIHCSIDKEPFGRVITEGFAASVPVISTALGGPQELIEDGYNGQNFFPYDYYSLYEKIKQIVEDNVLREKIVANAFKKSQLIEKTIEAQMIKFIEG